ncbi:MAG TPA: efflux RND transporter periplasmic adaptor subunit [Blastocatellia bacterium]|nr:efflux RND transporter periplasmic adaptor subunit [Blastocatellia bacterium]
MLFAILSKTRSLILPTPAPRTGRGLAAAGLIALLSLASAGCKSGYPVAAKNNAGEPKEARPVKIAYVTQIPMESAVTVTGTLAAQDQTTVSAKVPGRVQTITVDLGSVVRKGQALAQLEPQDYQLRLQQAEAALAQARARVGLSPEGKDERVNPENTGTVRQARALLDQSKQNRERSAALFNQGVIARAQLDAAEAEYKVALSRYQDAIEEIRNRQALVVQRRSEFEIAKQQLLDLTVYAPYDGVVQEKRASVGEYLAAGAPIVNIVRMDPLRLRAEVPEREASKVHAGQQVRVTIEGDPNAYTGHIARLSPTITAQNRILVVEAEVRNNGALRPGSFARADIVADDKGVSPAVPVSAVVSFAGIDKVITIQDGKAVEKPVTLGRRAGDWTEILSGINVGDAIVVNPGNLQSGQSVVVSE